MRLDRRTCRLAAWLAIWALLLSALLPALGHAARADAPPDWGEICTTGGLRSIGSVGTPPADADPAPASVQALAHCPWCSLHTPVADLPPAGPRPWPAVHVAPAPPPTAVPAPRTPLPWMRARSRAPPHAG